MAQIDMLQGDTHQSVAGEMTPLVDKDKWVEIVVVAEGPKPDAVEITVLEYTEKGGGTSICYHRLFTPIYTIGLIIFIPILYGLIFSQVHGELLGDSPENIIPGYGEF